jgi:hypothetical protein
VCHEKDKSTLCFHTRRLFGRLGRAMTKNVFLYYTGEFALQNRMPRKTRLIAPIRIFQ